MTNNVILLGQFLLNFVISFSMKKMMQTIKILQMLSFLNLIQINFSPISKVYLESLFSFATFKAVPPELMEYITFKLGITSRD